MRTMLRPDRMSDVSTRPRVARWVLIAVAVLTVGSLSAVAVAAVRGQRATGGARATPAAGRATVNGGMPVGYARDAAGATLAASNFVVALSGPLTVNPDTRPAALAAVSATGVTPGVAERFASWSRVERFTGLIAAVRTGAPKVLNTAPMGIRIRAFTPDHAVVDVWTVAVVGTSTSGRADSHWTTETLTLDWQGDWKLNNNSSAAPQARQASDPRPGLHLGNDECGRKH